MKHGDRVEIPSIPEIPALRDSTRRYLGYIFDWNVESSSVTSEVAVELSDS